MKQLSEKALRAIEGNPRVMNLLAAEFYVTESTVRRWIENNNDMLVSVAALKIIRVETELTDDEILNQEVAK